MTGRKHHLEVKVDFELIDFFQHLWNCFFQNDERRYIALSTFGFYQGGILDVKLSNFQIDPGQVQVESIVSLRQNFFLENVKHITSFSVWTIFGQNHYGCHEPLSR